MFKNNANTHVTPAVRRRGSRLSEGIPLDSRLRGNDEPEQLQNNIQKIVFSFALIGVIFFPRISRAEDSASTNAEIASSTVAASESAASVSTSTQAAKAAKKVKEVTAQAAQIKSSFLDRKAEWHFLETQPTPQDKGVASALVRAMSLFIAANPEAPEAPKAWTMLASLDRSAGDDKSALVAYLHLIYEYPKAPETLEAQSIFLTLAKKTLGGRLSPGWQELATPPENLKTDQRLATLLERVSKDTGGLLRKPLWQEFLSFEARFPNYPNADGILLSLAQTFEQDSRLNESLVFFRELLSAYPSSLYAADAQFQIASLHERLGDYQKAVGSYQTLIKNYPQSDKVLPSLEGLALVFSKKLDQWPLAVETDKEIVKRFPNTPAALNALKNAVSSSKKLSDFKGEVDFLVAIANDFPQSDEASISIYRAAGICYEQTKDEAQAESLYRRYLDYPGHWFNPASWWRRHKAKHRLSILAPATTAPAKTSSMN